MGDAKVFVIISKVFNKSLKDQVEFECNLPHIWLRINFKIEKIIFLIYTIFDSTLILYYNKLTWKEFNKDLIRLINWNDIQQIFEDVFLLICHVQKGIMWKLWVGRI